MADQPQDDGTVNRRRFLGMLGIGAAAVAGGAAAGAATASAAGSDDGLASERLVVDIACLGHTRRWLRAEAPADDAEGRSTDSVEGWIYPEGTIPGDGFVPTAEGSIGRWFCWGWSIFDAERPEPHLVTNHNYVMGAIRPERQFPPDTLSSTGLQGTFEDDQLAVRAVNGGTGAYLGATGQVFQSNNGRNTTVLAGVGAQAPNWVFEFDLLVPA